MGKTLPLAEASTLVSEVNLLDSTMRSLESELNKVDEQIEFNKAEIAKRMKLEIQIEELEKRVKQLQDEWHSRKNERDARVGKLTDGGWVVPIPKNEGAKGRMVL